MVEKRCGYVSLCGRPNVGKSTLLNRMVGQKLSITAHKPQTTRHAILGIKTTADAQFVFIDTPGMHGSGKRTLNRVLNKTASAAANTADIAVLLVQALVWTEDDTLALNTVVSQHGEFILAVNKVDTVNPREKLLPWLSQLEAVNQAAAVVPVSATRGSNVDALEQEIRSRLPVGDFIFDEDALTDRSSRFLAGELVREQLTRLLAKELPYAVSVEIENFEEHPKLLRISAVIWVEKPGQKAIVIGKGGAGLKQIGSRARQEMQKLFDQNVHLDLWVKVVNGWSDDAAMIRSLGYDTE
jgi:GTP-binding protein Era